jgi:cytochrome c oxidase subunit 3
VSHIDIPYASTPRPDTGVSNATLAMWLFIASEIMLFGALFSSYALLRIGNPSWPDQQSLLSPLLGAMNSVVMIASSVAITLARRAMVSSGPRACRGLLAAAVGLGIVFLGVKSIEWARELGAGLLPSSSNFLGLYYAMTGLHALHVLAGVAAGGYLLATVAALHERRPAQAVSRVRQAALYWNFIDAVWIAMFIVLYLL